MTITPITESDPLLTLCNKLAEADYITVDTEFLREKTYWPKLCLIQVASTEVEAVIDPLADGLDMAPFYDLMQKESILKVFHAARQDMEIFFQKMNSVPKPIFDTQIAAMVLGHGDQAGYETLVNKVLNRQVDKSARFTDWSMRPLNQKQLSYAQSDVTHLRDIYEKFAQQLAEMNRTSWVDDETAYLMDPATYTVIPEECWRRIKSRGTEPRFLGVLREVAAWREREAQARDIPKNRILRDEALLDIAGTKPQDVKALKKIRGVSDGFADGKMGNGILKAIATALDLPDEDLPRLPRRPRLPDGIGPLTDLLKVLLKRQSERHLIAARVVATSDELEKLASQDDPDIPAMSGWRWEVFGKRAMELKSGKLAITAKGKDIEIIEIEDDED
ncbi:ribonuclease D [Curvivirga sp.]|uniref:ribonuclease D n=1 Tax=Curvivirga sp. TaxID=2856848 RepID=UPI003B5975A9